MKFELEVKRFVANKRIWLRFRYKNFIIGFLIIWMGFLFTPLLSHGQNINPQILIMNSYHNGFEWSDKELAGLTERFRQGYPTIAPYIEYIDAKRFPGNGHLLRMQDYLIDKYQGRKIDLVVTLDDPALQLALLSRSRLFAKVPIVFAGVNYFDPDMVKGHKNITGLSEFQDIDGTLKVALKLFPHCKKVLAIHDYTSSGLATRQATEMILPEYQSRVNIRFTPPSTFNDVLDQLKSLPPNSVAIILSFVTDSSGKSLTLAESTRIFTSIPSIPVFSLNEPRLGHGIVGGILVSGKKQGQRAGDIALRILSGVEPSAITVDTRSSSLPEFDYLQLVRFNIPLKSLPKESIIIDRPESFYGKYRGLVSGTLALILTLTLMLIFLTWTIIRRRRAEEALQESEALLKKSQEMAHVGTWRLNLKKNELYWSDEVYRIFGLTPKEFCPTYEAFLNAVHPDDRERVDCTYAVAGKEKQTYDIIHRVLCPDGTIRIVHEKSEDIRDETGEITVSIGMVHDITEIKQFEENLRQREAVLESILRAAPTGIGMVVDRVITFVNERFCEMMGYHKDELVGLNSRSLYPTDEEFEWVGKEKYDQISKKGTGTVETQLLTKNGRIIDVLLSSTPMDLSDLSKGVTFTALDIGERKKSEKEIRVLNANLELRVQQRTADLKEINKELEDFVYSISHDLRAPLRSISGFSEIIDRRHKGSLNEEGQHYFNNIIKASKQMGELIDDLLKFSRLGRSSIKSEKILLNDVFKTAMETLSDEIKKTGAQVNIPEQLPVVQGDLTLITHVFINLMENALKYHKPDIPPVIDIDFEILAPHVVISVIDNGIGIDPAYHENIFKIFQRLHSQADYPGTGIGLAAVKKAIQMMGGNIQVESDFGKGSVFIVKFIMATTV